MTIFGLVFLVGAAAFLIAIVGSLVKTRLSLAVFFTVSFAQFVCYFTASSYAFGLGDAAIVAALEQGHSPATAILPASLDAALAVLGVPLMYLLNIPATYFGNRWWGDDANFMIGLMLLNSATWGFAAAIAHRVIKARKRAYRAPGPTK
jgi:hypothetical protein